ncbi:class I SAM-dependent methyltransferase [Pseudoflavonifractor sp. MCC625]|uniref:class I SAM-dependent methyltransferase n=1 Tax=Pseudoflavonifractor sp. MCC625 TaxID=2592647 RepID=UPI002078F466|nr:class I SAM-dependent methyltransferase [Pseudoflavonifractor sp. MCC625]
MTPLLSTPYPDLRGDLDYFLSMQESQPVDRPDHSAQKWDQRADAWEQEGPKAQKGDARVRSTMAYLEERGLLRPEYEIADIGCGPARFAAAFASRVRWVTGFDLSPRMVHYGSEYARKQGVENLTLRVADFQTLDVQEEGLEKAFDLVFSSLTPAIHGKLGLQKVVSMSRAYCCNITHIYRRNSLCRRLREEVFHLPPEAPTWGIRWFYSLFNALLLMGYLPETSYDSRLQERRLPPSERYASLLMEHTLPREARTPEHQARILDWMERNTDADGLLTESIEACYGRILWDVRVSSAPEKIHAEKEV